MKFVEGVISKLKFSVFMNHLYCWMMLLRVIHIEIATVLNFAKLYPLKTKYMYLCQNRPMLSFEMLKFCLLYRKSWSIARTASVQEFQFLKKKNHFLYNFKLFNYFWLDLYYIVMSLFFITVLKKCEDWDYFITMIKISDLWGSKQP